MKRHKKLVSLLIALCFVFSLVPMAAASTAPAAHPADGATARLNALGIVEGYPDGTFGLNRDITRAEFAKIAVSLVGMKDGADMLRATPSQFTDVRTDVWYTGWINMAAGLGLIKGDPAGTFRPNDRVSNGEVITILLRALGYNDHLVGPWPLNYMAQAARLGITTGVAADARAAAVRGNVFIMGNRALDAIWVEYDRDTNRFNENKDDQTLLAQNFKGSFVEDKIVVDWRKSGDRYEIRVFDRDDTLTAGFHAISDANATWVRLARNATIAGTDHVSGLADRFVNYSTNDDKEITFVERRPYTQVNRVEADVENSNLSEFEWLSTTRIRMGGVSYNMAAEGWLASVTVPASTATFPVKVTGERIRLVLNKDGEVAAIRTSDFHRPALVDSVIPARHRISVKVAAENTVTPVINRAFPADLSTASYVIMRGTREVAIADLKPWELLYVTPGGNGVDWSFTVVDRKATGVLDVVQTSGTTVFNVRVGGTNYSVSAPAQVSTDNGDTFLSTFGDAGKLIGEQVTVYLDHSGDVVYMVGDARGIGAAGNYGQVVKVNPATGVGTGGAIVATGIASVELLLANGTKATYLADGNSRITDQAGATRDADEPLAFDNLDRGDFVEFRLRADGRVDRMTEVTTSIPSLGVITGGTGQVDDDNNRILINNSWFLAGDAVVFNVTATGTEVERIASWSMVENESTGANTIVNVFYVTSGNRVTHLAVSTEQLGAAVNYAVVMETGQDRDGIYVRLMDSKGTVTRYAYNNVAGFAQLGFRSVVNFTATGDDLTGTVHEVVYDTRTDNKIATVTAIDRTGRGAVRLQENVPAGQTAAANVWYYLDSDTVLYNLAGTPRVITLADLAVGDQVVYRNLTHTTEELGMIDKGNFNFLAVRNP